MRSSTAWDVYKTLAAFPDYYFWRLRGSPMRRVPHLVKQRTLQAYARRYNLRVMVETGTNLGQMIAAMLPQMDAIYSIEMDDWSYHRARNRFAGNPKVHPVHGDSTVELPRLIPSLPRPALFWLDAHNFDLETPIRGELAAIASRPLQGDVILIDDSKWFDGRNQYPTMEWMHAFVRDRIPGYQLADAMHILRIEPEARS